MQRLTYEIIANFKHNFESYKYNLLSLKCGGLTWVLYLKGYRVVLEASTWLHILSSMVTHQPKEFSCEPSRITSLLSQEFYLHVNSNVYIQIDPTKWTAKLEPLHI